MALWLSAIIRRRIAQEVAVGITASMREQRLRLPAAEAHSGRRAECGRCGKQAATLLAEHDTVYSVETPSLPKLESPHGARTSNRRNE